MYNNLVSAKETLHSIKDQGNHYKMIESICATKKKKKEKGKLWHKNAVAELTNISRQMAIMPTSRMSCRVQISISTSKEDI